LAGECRVVEDDRAALDARATVIERDAQTLDARRREVERDRAELQRVQRAHEKTEAKAEKRRAHAAEELDGRERQLEALKAALGGARSGRACAGPETDAAGRVQRRDARGARRVARSRVPRARRGMAVVSALVA